MCLLGTSGCVCLSGVPQGVYGSQVYLRVGILSTVGTSQGGYPPVGTSQGVYLSRCEPQGVYLLPL